MSKKYNFDNLKDYCEEQLISGAISLWNNSFNEYNSSNDGFPTDYALEQMIRNGMVAMLMLESVAYENISKETDISDKEKENITRACENLITMKKSYMNLKSYRISFVGGVTTHQVSKCITLQVKQNATNDIRKCYEILKTIDPSYEVPVIEDPAEASTSNGRCYVATAVYGSYDCPQVWTLRRYRDNTLAKTWYGRAFIHTYYAISPILVRWFGHTEWFKKMWKSKLNSMVKNLQKNGVESTPYEDRIW